MRTLLFTAVLTLLTAPALADPPASIGDPNQARVEGQFHEFAKQWMSRVQTLQAKPVAMVGASQPIFTYRGYGDDYTIELRPTSHAAAPYVGLLRYTENVYSCTSADAKDCRIASSVPVTEIFRYQDGHWSY
jgi:hypothetical protein